MKRLSLAIVVALIPGALSAQPTSAVCRIVANSADGRGFDFGSGTLVMDNGYTGVVYSAAHVVRDSNPSTISCAFADGRKFRGVLIGLDKSNDFAAICILSPKNITPFPTGKYEGGPIYVGGWGNPREQLRFLPGAISAIRWQQRGLHSLGGGATMREGDSGGPAINNGRLIGIAWGVDESDGSVMFNADEPFAHFDSTIKQLVKSGCDVRTVSETGCKWVRDQYGNCVQVCDQSPVYRPPANVVTPPPALQPPRPTTTTVSVPGPQGPAGPVGPQGPQGPKGEPGSAGDSASCECEPKWTAINARIDALASEMNDAKTTVNNLVTVVNELKANQAKSPSLDEIVAAVEKNRQPPRLRVLDPQGKYTTEFITLRDGTDNDIIIDQRFTTGSTLVQ